MFEWFTIHEIYSDPVLCIIQADEKLLRVQISKSKVHKTILVGNYE